MKKGFIISFILGALCLLALGAANWRPYSAGRPTHYLSTEVPAGQTITDAVAIRNKGTVTTGLQFTGAYTVDMNLQNGDTIDNNAAGTITFAASELVDEEGLNVRYAAPQDVAAVPAQPWACDAAHLGEIIYNDDNNDTAESYLCFCGIDADDATHIWLRADIPATDCY